MATTCLGQGGIAKSAFPPGSRSKNLVLKRSTLVSYGHETSLSFFLFEESPYGGLAPTQSPSPPPKKKKKRKRLRSPRPRNGPAGLSAFFEAKGILVGWRKGKPKGD